MVIDPNSQLAADMRKALKGHDLESVISTLEGLTVDSTTELSGRA